MLRILGCCASWDVAHVLNQLLIGCGSAPRGSSGSELSRFGAESGSGLSRFGAESGSELSRFGAEPVVSPLAQSPAAVAL